MFFLIFRIFLTCLVGVFSTMMVRSSLWLLNQPSDWAVGGGVFVGLVSVLICAYWLISIWTWRSYKYDTYL